MVRYGSTDEQRKVLKAIRQYYPEDTGFIMLIMDMEYMGAGTPKKKFAEQLKELSDLRLHQDSSGILYKDNLYPFIFIDPRRLHPNDKIEQLNLMSYELH